MMGLEAVGDLALHTILSKLEAEDSARAACVSKKLRASASEDSLWSHFCARDLDLSQPLDPHGNLTPSFKVFPSNSYHLKSNHVFLFKFVGFELNFYLASNFREFVVMVK